LTDEETDEAVGKAKNEGFDDHTPSMAKDTGQRTENTRIDLVHASLFYDTNFTADATMGQAAHNAGLKPGAVPPAAAAAAATVPPTVPPTVLPPPAAAPTPAAASPPAGSAAPAPAPVPAPAGKTFIFRTSTAFDSIYHNKMHWSMSHPELFPYGRGNCFFNYF